MAKALAQLIDQLLVDKNSLIKLMKLTTAQAAPGSSSSNKLTPATMQQDSNERISERSAEDGGGSYPAISFANLLNYPAIKEQLTAFGLDSSTLQQT